MTSPRIGKFDQSMQIQWSDGSPFNGFACIGIVRPTTNGLPSGVVPLTLRGKAAVTTPLPAGFSLIPVIDGRLNSALGLYWNEDIEPPNTQYVLYYADSGKRIVAGPSSFFTVSGQVVLPTLTIPAPTTVNAVAPVPD